MVFTLRLERFSTLKFWCPVLVIAAGYICLFFFLIVSIKCGVYFPTSGIGAPGLVSFGLIEYGDEYKQDD